MISQTDMLFLHLMKTLLLFVFLAVGQFAFAQDEPDFSGYAQLAYPQQ